jgi:hypothetical protein
MTEDKDFDLLMNGGASADLSPPKKQKYVLQRSGFGKYCSEMISGRYQIMGMVIGSGYYIVDHHFMAKGDELRMTIRDKNRDTERFDTIEDAQMRIAELTFGL